MDTTDTDITARDEEDLTLKLELFEHLIDGIKDYAIFVIKPDGSIGTWNRGVKRLLGYDEAEFVGKPFASIFTPEDAARGVAEEELRRASEVGKAEDERWHLRRDGVRFWASGLVTAMRGPDGALRGFTKIMRDETSRKRVQEQLAKQAESLEAVNDELRNFAGLVSHDLSAPLQSIRGFAHVLAQAEDLGDDADESVRQIIGNTERMIHLIHELLTYAQNDASPSVHNLVDSTVVAREVVSALDARIQVTGGSVAIGPLPPLIVDATQLGRVLQNLIDNALKYRRQNIRPLVSVEAREESTCVVFSVKDNGVGIPVEEREKIFEPFRRGSHRADVYGVGLGLSACRKIVEHWGGTIAVASEVGRGSVFSFTVPQPELPLRERLARTIAEISSQPNESLHAVVERSAESARTLIGG